MSLLPGKYIALDSTLGVDEMTVKGKTPPYQLNATELCLEFYYNMNGLQVNVLQVISKPFCNCNVHAFAFENKSSSKEV